MDIEEIRFFIDLVDSKSFTYTAEKNNVATSTMSRAVTKLEEEFKVKLLQRTTRKVSVTDEGILFYSKMKLIIDEIDTVKDDLVNQQDEPSGILRLTCPVSFGIEIMPRAIAKFKKQYPKVNIELIASDQRLDLVFNKIDLAVRFGQLEDSSMIAKRLAKLNYVLVASRKYLKNNPPIKKPKDLIKHNCLNYLLPNIKNNWYFKNLQTKNEQQIEIEPYMNISNPSIIKELTLKHQGLALMADILVEKELKRGTLVRLLNNYEVTATNFDNNIWLLYPSKQFVPQRVRKFTETLESFI
ncbi:MAG: LysR family transcriptional regulator [Candidatus Caenarcaniphilales bacterium]|nr:LysR family transcriptional regulator [Candidatus Caenarcaniphilales bacterium]